MKLIVRERRQLSSPLGQKSVGPRQDSEILLVTTIFVTVATFFKMTRALMRWSHTHSYIGTPRIQRARKLLEDLMHTRRKARGKARELWVPTKSSPNLNDQVTYPRLTGHTRSRTGVATICQRTKATISAPRPKERGTPPRQRDPTSYHYIRNINILKYNNNNIFN